MGPQEAVRGITIDGPTSRDLDDAIWLDVGRDGEPSCVHVSIADVASFVPVGSALDRDAYRRSFTRYYRLANDPMLPRSISENNASLVPGVPRPAITVSVELSPVHDVTSVRIRRTVLVSQQQLSYEEAHRLAADTESPLRVMLRACSRLARALLKKRRQEGALAFWDREAGLATTEEGMPVRLLAHQAFDSHLTIQEFMILANRVVAHYLASRGVPLLFRNHTASAVAPQREQLVADISHMIAAPHQFSLETLRNRMRLVLNRAKYGPHLEGHFALNLPAYTHFTSPIRRYADLINHRILGAVMLGEQPPYTMEQLEEAAEHINTIQAEMRDQRSAHLKEKAYRQADSAVEADLLKGLGVREFQLVVKRFCRGTEEHEKVEAEMVQRLHDNRLELRDVLEPILAASPNAAVRRLQEEVWRWLERHPQHAVSLFTMARQVAGWNEVTYDVRTSGGDHALTFAATCAVTVRGSRHEFVSPQFNSKRQATQAAAVGLWASILQLPSPSALSDPAPLPEAQRSPLPPPNAKGRLQEFCQQNGWPMPTYTSEQTGLPHQAQFSAVVQVEAGARVHRGEPCRASTRREAEQKVAAAMLEWLRKPPCTSLETSCGPPPPLSVPQAYDGMNYVGRLQEYCLQSGLPLPEYTFEIAEPDVGCCCACTVRLQSGSWQRQSARGRSKALAKQRAAHAVLAGWLDTSDNAGQ